MNNFKQLIAFYVLLFAAVSSQSVSAAGYSYGNFGMAGWVSSDGLAVQQSLINSPVLGQWLGSFATGQLSALELPQAGTSGGGFGITNLVSLFPENKVTLVPLTNSNRPGNVKIDVQTYSPLSSNQASLAEPDPSFDNFLPVTVVKLKIENKNAQVRRFKLSYVLSPLQQRWVNEGANATRFVQSSGELFGRAFFNVSGQIPMATPLVGSGSTVDTKAVFLTAVVNRQGTGLGPLKANYRRTADQLHLEIEVEVLGQKTGTTYFIFGEHHSGGYTAPKLSRVDDLRNYVIQNLDKFERNLVEFIKVLPKTGDSEIDQYVRWYLSAGIFLTKGNRDQNVLTMGYSELNQRDSFWTSGLHLVFWPELERKMLQESNDAQLSSGKIPTTILPIINREGDIDINEYFILRHVRYYKWTRDRAFLVASLPKLKKAVQYLVGLDSEGVGLPMQRSFWADWKDVPGVNGRKYAPHFSLLWLAVLKNMQYLAHEANDLDYEKELIAQFIKANTFINRPFKEGGMWNQDRYVDLWQDGREVPYALEDQTVGAVFGVVSNDRLKKIYETLTKSESPFGVRDTFPYIVPFEQPHGVGGNYHNGGVWPYLNFVDVWGRYLKGYSNDAERILKKVAFNDLVKGLDYTPHEFLNGDSGANRGLPIQAWNSVLFSSLYFGAFGLQRVSPNVLEIQLNLPKNRDFETFIRIPEGNFELRRKAGKTEIVRHFSTPLEIRLNSP